MSAAGDEWADAAMQAIRRGTAIAKSAGGPSGDEVTEAVIRGICGAFASFADMVAEHTEYMDKVLNAIAAPGPEQQYAATLGPLRPDQWRVGLVPNLPGREPPVRGNNDEFS